MRLDVFEFVWCKVCDVTEAIAVARTVQLLESVCYPRIAGN